MTEQEIISGNDAICTMLGFEQTKAYHYKVPNLFPKEVDTGYTEMDTSDTQFHIDWNMLIGSYNKMLALMQDMPDTAKELLKTDKNFLVNYGARNFFCLFENQLSISSCWIKLVDFAKWYNAVSFTFKK